MVRRVRWTVARVRAGLTLVLFGCVLTGAAQAVHHIVPEPSPVARRALTGHDPVIASVQRTEAFLKRADTSDAIETGSLRAPMFGLEAAALLAFALLIGWLMTGAVLPYRTQGRSATWIDQATAPPLDEAAAPAASPNPATLGCPRSRG